MAVKFALVTDSTSDIPKDLVSKNQIYVAPLHIMWGSDHLVDGIDITPETFYDRLQSDSILPTTSQPTPKEFADLYEKARAESGAEDVLTLTISSDLSGTNSSALMGAKMVDFPVHVVDIRTTTVALGLAVLKLVEARDSGATIEEGVELAQSLSTRTHTVFTLDTLEYLHKGGRIGGAQRLLGTALNIKPILHVHEGKVEPKESVRTRKRAFSRLVELADELIDPDKPLHMGVLHGQDEESAEQLAAIFQERYKPERMVVTQVATVIGVHTGPRAVGFSLLQ